MFLRSLTIKGFKSFAETTTLDLEPGVTVVVGPNGSGKSNVVDAVAWVLGAQGPRMLRSARMDDVIFAGGGGRSPLGRAEVTLTIDNSSGLLPIEFSEVTITRTLFRSSGESDYAINGVSCRLLDVQELLSDTGVGRQQHVIVSQGNLDGVLDARPDERRLIVEEAAGILKYRRRKEKAERRLEATEGNLLRLADLLREVRRQLRPLERQAAAARRHGELASELRALRLYLAGRELTALGARLAGATRARGTAATEEAAVRARLDGIDESVGSAERWLAAAGRERPHEVVARLEALRERARGLAAVLAERRRSLARHRQSEMERSLVVSLEAELVRLDGELGETGEAITAAEEELAGVAAQEAEIETAAAGGPVGDDARSMPFEGAAEARGQLRALRAMVERDRQVQARLADELTGLDQRAQQLETDVAPRRAAVDEATGERTRLASALDEAKAARSEASADVVAAEGRLRELEGELHRWIARADALALAAAAPRTDDEHRAQFGDELVGVLAELVEVDPGWEAPFEAAAAGAVASLVVLGAEGAREALTRLRRNGDAAAVLATGVPVPTPADVPAGVPGQRVRAHVRARDPRVDAVLDRVLARAVAVDHGWAEVLDVALAYPDLVVVSRQGDRFAPDGWRVGWHGPGAAVAALDEARREADTTSAAVTAAEHELARAHVAAAEAGTRQSEGSRALADHDRSLAAVVEALARTEAAQREAAAAIRHRRDQLAEVDRRLDDAQAQVGVTETSLPTLEAEEAARATVATAAVAEQGRREERRHGLLAVRRQVEARLAQLVERRRQLAGRRAEVEAALARAGGEQGPAAVTLQELELIGARTARLSEFLDGRIGAIGAHLAGARERLERHSELVRAGSQRLERLRRERAGTERGLEEALERGRRSEVEEAEARLRVEAAEETLRRELDCEPVTAMAAECPELPPGTSAESRTRELERELRMLGPVNPLALEELTSLEERNTFLQTQLDDVKTTRRELGKVIRAVDAEMTELLSAAFADVADNFEQLFETLFPGGRGRLRLTDAETLLEAGVDIEAQPAGKNVRRLSLLSGGERSLVALAFLFAVFRSRPSPFYLLDEVEAALDDVNLHRFLHLLDEFRDHSQLLVVSHQKRTMEAADALYGVTMQAGGSSRVISERVRPAPVEPARAPSTV